MTYKSILLNSLATSLVASSSQAIQYNGSCKAVVLSGGGSNGAWESGVLWGLLHYGEPADYVYDVVTGVSIGSINAAGLAVFEKGKELEASDFIYSTWQSITSEDIYTERTMGLVSGLFQPSIYDTAVGIETLSHILSRFDGYKRAISLSAVEIQTGAIINMTEQNTPFSELPRAIVASASVPGFFPPQELNGRLLVDGMTAYNTNVQEAIDRCKEITDDDTKITIDIIVCEMDDQIAKWDESGNAWKNYWRVQDIRNRYHSSNALAGVMRAYPDINWRHVINQSMRESLQHALDFSNEVTDPLQEAGKQDALRALGKEVDRSSEPDEVSDEEEYESRFNVSGEVLQWTNSLLDRFTAQGSQDYDNDDQ